MVRDLLHAAIAVPQVLVPVATKVLFRKRRSLIPMLDNVVLAYYFDAFDQPRLLGRSQDKHHAANVAITVLRAFRNDLANSHGLLCALAERSETAARPVGPVRILEVMVWSQVEPRGYYRS